MRDGKNSPDSEIPFGAGRHRTNGTNGAHPEGMKTHGIPLGEDPIDLVAVQADDELINALQAGMTVSAPGLNGYASDDRVAAVLAAWKTEVDADPIPELVDIDTAMAAIESARRSTARRPRRHLAPVAAAAAFVVLTIGGASIGSADSEPGDALWGVSKVLYSERAESVEAAARVETRISTAKKALVDGRPEVAAQELQAAQADLATVRPQEGRADLADVQSFLVAKADETSPGTPIDPGAPLTQDQTRMVPKGAGLTEPPKPSDPGTMSPRPPVVVGPVSPAGPQVSVDPAPATDPRYPTRAPTTSPAIPADGGAVPNTPGSAPTSTIIEGGPATTTPSESIGGAAVSPSTSTSTSTAASGTGATSPAAGAS